VAETCKDNGLEVSEYVVSNLNHVDNEKPSCSSVNGTAAVVEEQLVVDCVVGPRFSSVQCASMEEEEEDDDDDDASDIMTQSQDEEILLDLSDLEL